jgi:hypothetical protein
MFQIREDSMQRLMEASQQLHGALVSSPMWELLKNEPVIVSWINALSEVETQIKQEQANAPQAKPFPENQSQS